MAMAMPLLPVSTWYSDDEWEYGYEPALVAAPLPASA
jgi:hypothetical protein